MELNPPFSSLFFRETPLEIYSQISLKISLQECCSTNGLVSMQTSEKLERQSEGGENSKINLHPSSICFIKEPEVVGTKPSTD